MSYVINVTVKKSSDSDWRQCQPAGDGWNVVNNKYGDGQDFNQEAGGKYIYLCYLRNSDSEYISEFESGESVESAFNDFDSSAVVLRQDLNQGA